MMRDGKEDQAISEKTPVLAGYGIKTITPQAMMPMAGFDLRQEKAVGVHDPLSVRALVLDTNGVQTALLVYDLLGVPMYLRDRILKEAAPDFGADHVILAAIHTHAAPKTHFRSFAIFDPSYEDRLVQAGKEALSDAKEDLAKAELTLQETFAENVASFRDAPREASAFSMPVDILTFQRSSADLAKPDIRLIVMRTHPTVLNEKNLLMSRDLVYGMDTALQTDGDKAVNIFMNGACADVSTRYTRKEASFEEVLRLGSNFAKAVRSATPIPESRSAKTAPENSGETDNSKVIARSLMLTIPPATFFDQDERRAIVEKLEKKIALCHDEAQKREYIACRSVLLRPLYGKKPDGTPKDGEVVPILVLRLFVCDLIFLPFEYAIKDERVLKAAAEEQTGRPAVVVCYANGYEGYLPTGRPLDENSGYEDMASSFRYDAKELIKEAVLTLLSNEERL